jgi:hypothetical protein
VSDDAGLRVRPLHAGEVPALAAAALDEGRSADLLGHLVRTDPGGCWAAEGASGLLGVALSARRELMWLPARSEVLPGIAPDLRDTVADVLQEAAASYGSGCLRAAVLLGTDAETARRARLGGFSLHPTTTLRGYVDRTTLPVVDRVRDGVPGDRDLLDSVDRSARGAAHGPDHDLLMRWHPFVVMDRPTGSGYAYLGPEGPVLLAATGRRVAVDLLWQALAATSGEVALRHVTPANEWALDVGLAVGLRLDLGGWTALRGMRPPAPYLPHPVVF